MQKKQKVGGALQKLTLETDKNSKTDANPPTEGKGAKHREREEDAADQMFTLARNPSVGEKDEMNTEN